MVVRPLGQRYDWVASTITSGDHLGAVIEEFFAGDCPRRAIGLLKIEMLPPPILRMEKAMVKFAM